MVLLPDSMPFLCYFYFICSSTTWNTYTTFRKNAGGRVGCEGPWKTWVRLILLTRGPEEPVPSQGANSNTPGRVGTLYLQCKFAYNDGEVQGLDPQVPDEL